VYKPTISILATIIVLVATITTSNALADHSGDLAGVLAAQPEETQQRYGARHPQETLEFFGIKPGMTVVEALPGGGWYTKILMPYLGHDGHLFGANYSNDMFPLFGFFPEERLEALKTWDKDWPKEAQGWGDDHSASVSAFNMGSLPDSKAGKADAVLLIRALHNLARFEGEGGFLTTALAEAHRVLKPGGIVGIVQHSARDNMTDEQTTGARGYLRKSFVIQQMKNAGFELVAESDINANPKDQPGEDDVVWRLPPTLATSGENPELREELTAIGESNRMTLKFLKAH
jgi:predicted methyltransferase